MCWTQLYSKIIKQTKHDINVKQITGYTYICDLRQNDADGNLVSEWSLLLLGTKRIVENENKPIIVWSKLQ